MTPYELIKVMNRRFGGNRHTQMGYNYARKGYVKATKTENGWYIDPADAEEFLAKFADKNKLTPVE